MVSKSEYFDGSYYGQQVQRLQANLPKDLFGHYLQVGWRFGLDPHTEFSTNGYLAENPDVWKAGVNPLVHYEEWGKAEERDIVSVAEYESRPGAKKIIRRVELVDLTYYQAQVNDKRFSDVLAALDHYLATGWREGLDPHPSFSTRGYLHDNWDVAAAGIDPLTHFVLYGLSEGRALVDPVAFASPGYRTPDPPWATDIRESLTSHLRHLGIEFDSSELNVQGDTFVLDADFEWFDAVFYLGRYDDVARASVPAFAHFVFAGHREGRFPNASIGAELALRTDTERVLLARSLSEHSYDDVPDSGEDVRTGASVVSELVDRQLVNSSKFVVAFAHDDYVGHIGGIQIVSAREEVLFRELGDSYISVFPNRPLLALNSSAENDVLVRCRVGGVLIEGAFPLGEFAQAFSEQFSGHEVVVVLHSIFGHSPEAIQSAMQSLQPSIACWWVHDYSAHCQNYRLTRNGVNWCGDPAPGSQSCQVCTFGPVRGQHLARVRALIDSYDWIFAAPSEVAADQSVAGNTPLPRRPLVVPHGLIRRDGSTREPCGEGDKVRVAFVGHPATIKGWNRFRAFVSDAGAYADSFEFFHFGVNDQSLAGVRFVETRPRSGGRSMTTEALLEYRIDAVMNFVDGKETFNFVTFEAMAAGCCIVTSPRSGNVLAAASVEGLLIELEDDSIEFDYVALRDEIRAKRRCDFGEFQITGLTPSLLREVNQ